MSEDRTQTAPAVSRIAVLTSGGDAPGMNAAIRAVVRRGIDRGLEVMGVKHGYTGLIAGDISPMLARDVGGILDRGGTLLGSSRCSEFKTEAGKQKAIAEARRLGIGALVIIGGNGSQTGAGDLSAMGFPVVGIASTIDNDLCGSDMTIGVDSALNVALEAMDRLRTTASSHRRGFLLEVMGRDCGYLALMTGIAGGAECVVLPEIPCDPEVVAVEMMRAYDRGKSHAIAVVAEGASYNAEALVKYFKDHKARLGFDLRATTLGHVQRGARPTAFDRLLATRLGVAAVDFIASGKYGVLTGVVGSRVVGTPFSEIVGRQKPLDPDLIAAAASLAI
jgi:6-phosphofructokinase 1